MTTWMTPIGVVDDRGGRRMAVRKYDDDGLKLAAKEMASSRKDDWIVRETRERALLIAKDLSEIGSRADEVISDAEKYAAYLLPGGTEPDGLAGIDPAMLLVELRSRGYQLIVQPPEGAESDLDDDTRTGHDQLPDPGFD